MEVEVHAISKACLPKRNPTLLRRRCAGVPSEFPSFARGGGGLFTARGQCRDPAIFTLSSGAAGVLLSGATGQRGSCGKTRGSSQTVS